MFQALLRRLFVASIPLIALAACGGGDTADRIDVADPAVRFVHAVPAGPTVALDRDGVVQSDAASVSYEFASNYFDVPMGTADWRVSTVTTPSVSLGSINIAPQRGTKYTIVATTGGVVLVVDPYNKSLTTNHSRLRLVNASFNAGSVDLYLTPTTDISGASPTVGATAFDTAGPPSGGDSVDIAGGTYQLTVTSAGNKTTVLFASQLVVADNKDILLLTVPGLAGIKVLSKVEGDVGGAAELPSL